MRPTSSFTGRDMGLSASNAIIPPLASIGLIESLMTLSLIDELTETRGSTPRECVGQGVANVVTGFFGGMGGCAMIGQSMININSGGRGRLSGVSAAIFLLGFILFIPGLIELIPIASLVGVMFMVVIATFEWSSLRLLGKVPGADIFVIVLVSGVTVLMHNLALGVGVGIAASALVYAWEHAKELKLHLRKSTEKKRTYEIDGPLFFGTIREFKDLFSPAEDPNDVYLSFARSKVCDHSAIEAIHSISEKYRGLGKRLHLHDHARSAAVRPVIHRSVPVPGVVPRVPGHHLDQAPFNRASLYAVCRLCPDHAGEQRNYGKAL